jgi:hypothetical protein
MTSTAGFKTIGAPFQVKDPEWGAVGCTFGDFNGDVWPDVFIQGWGWQKILSNNRDGTFSDVTEKTGFPTKTRRNGYLTFAFDHNNDGLLDIFADRYALISAFGDWGVTQYCTCSNLLSPEGFTEHEMKGAPTIYQNNGDGTFTDIWEKSRFIPFGVMGINHGDFDNDGDQDVILGAGGPYFQQAEPYLFYRNDGGGGFSNIAPFTLKSIWGKGHGIGLADIDHDGGLDVMLQPGGYTPGDMWPVVLLRNTARGNNFLRIALKAGPGTNRAAIGARVRVLSGKTQQLQEVRSGGSFGTSSHTLHFGLGPRSLAEKIVVQWPNRKGTVTEIRSVPAGQTIEVDEATGSWRPLWRATPL